MDAEAGGRSNRKQEEKKKKRAAQALLRIHKRLREKCSTFSNANDWYEFIQEILNPVLDQYKSVLTENQQRRLREAARLVEAGRQGVEQACKALQFEIEKTLPSLQAAPALSTPFVIALGAIIGIAVLVGMVAAAANYSAVEVVVANDGCAPLSFPANLNVIPGIAVPVNAIHPGEQAVVKVPSLAIEIDSTQENTIQLRILGIAWNLGYQGNLSSISYDDIPDILHQQFQITLQPRSQHNLAIACN